MRNVLRRGERPSLITEPATTRRGEAMRPVLRFVHFDPAAGAAAGHSIAIAPAEVHVWAYLLGEPDDVVDAWSRVLSRDERDRADRFVRRGDRGRWIVAHGVLRHLLGRYCGVAPGSIAFVHGASGKPAIAGATGRAIAFNLAHSRGGALLAVANGAPIGVDLEQSRDDFDPLPIAHRFFHGTELDAILSTSPDLRRDAFFRHWVAKESVLKGQGVGLTFPLDSFCVTFESDDEVARVQSRDPALLDPAWLVRVLPLETGWRGAVAAGGEGWAVRLMR